MIVYVQAATYETIHEGFIESSKTLTIDGKEVYAGVNDGNAFLTINGSSLLLESGDCEKKDLWEVCLAYTNYSHHNGTLNKDIYKGYFEISAPVAEISLSTILDKEETINRGESIKVQSTFENTGVIKISDVEFNHNLEGFDIVSVEECFRNQEVVKWKGDLIAGKSITCKYTLTARDGASAPEAELTYSTKDGVQTITGDTSIDVNNISIEVMTIIENGTYELSDFVPVEVKVKNPSDTRISIIKLKITPQGAVEEDTELLIDKTEYTWSGTLESETEKGFNMSIQVANNPSITPVSISYKWDQQSDTYNTAIEIPVKDTTPTITQVEKNLHITNPSNFVIENVRVVFDDGSSQNIERIPSNSYAALPLKKSSKGKISWEQKDIGMMFAEVLIALNSAQTNTEIEQETSIETSNNTESEKSVLVQNTSKEINTQQQEPIVEFTEKKSVVSFPKVSLNPLWVANGIVGLIILIGIIYMVKHHGSHKEKNQDSE